MKQFTYTIVMVLAISVISCNKDDDSIEISASNITARWDVTEMNDGTGWVRTDSSRVILSEDGYCLIMGRLYSKAGMGAGKYSFSGNTATLRNDNGTVAVKCMFTEVRQHSATGTLTFSDNTKTEIKMKRNESQPLLYKEPTAFLQGIWKLTKSKNLHDTDYTTDEDGSAVFEGNNVTFQIKDKTYTSTFRRYSVMIIATTDEHYIISSADKQNEIGVHSDGKTMIFRRQ